MVSFWLFFGIIVVCTYSGNLTASITVPKFNLPVETLEDLADSKFKYGTLASSAMSTLIQVRGSD